MQMKYFSIPVWNSDAASDELNRFIASHRVLKVERQFVQNSDNSAWAVCVEYTSQGLQTSGMDSGKRSKIDYREVLNETDFALYAKLRDLRRQISSQIGVPVYTLFSNEQLAAMVQRRVTSRVQLLQIDGIGEGRADKYGQQFLELLCKQHNTGNDSET